MPQYQCLVNEDQGPFLQYLSGQSIAEDYSLWLSVLPQVPIRPLNLFLICAVVINSP